MTRRAAKLAAPGARVQDAWIAATALHHDAESWTRDDDFDGIPGLTVVRL